MRVLALRYWRADGSKTLAELRRRMDAVTYAEMQAWVASHPIAPETAAALRNEPAAPRATRAVNTAALTPRAPATPAKSPLESVEIALQLPADDWRRWELMPGLELHLKSNAAPITQNLAASDTKLQATSCGRYDRASWRVHAEKPASAADCFAILNDPGIKMDITVQQMVV